MDSSMREHLRRLVRAGRNRSQYAATLAFVSVFVVLAVVVGAIRQGISMVVPQQVLDCHYVGTGAHTHDASCYDADGNLVCPLTEREYHVHSDDCYTETRELACGFEEEHEHTDACYDEEGTLICGLVEHVHTDACYKVMRELTCGKEETTEVHTHGPGCFRTVMIEDGTGEPDADQQADDQQVDGQDVESDPAEGQDTVDEALTPEEAAEMPAQAFAHQFEDIDKNLVLRVDVSVPEGALPANSTMVATWVDPTTLDETTQKVVDKAISKAADGKVLDQQAVDITFFDAQGAEVEPAREVTVTFTSPLVATKDQPVVVHIDDSDETLAKTNGKPKAEAVAVLDEHELARRDVTLAEDALAFDSDAFSTYVLALTSLQHTMDSTDGKTVTVSVDAPAEAGIPSDAVIRVTEIAQGSDDHAAYEASAVEVLGVEDTRDVALARFFDIKIEDGQGQEIQPAEPVKVKIELSDAPSDAEDTGVVHFDEAGEAEVVEAKAAGETTTFDAAGFSVYGVVYTVDFHWSVNGATCDYSIDGGGVLSLTELLPALGVVDASEVGKVVAGIANVEFSNPSLVAATKLGEDMTAEAIAQALGVEPVYSAALSEEQVAELKAKQFAAGDWVLATLAPFDTNETLTVTMENGDTFEIAVTDARLVAKVLTADGQNWTITVEYDDAAEIPAGAELEARELKEGSVEYEKYLTGAATALGVQNKDVSLARFFDISIMVGEEKIEPKAPVQVKIEHADALDVSLGETLSVVHFAEEQGGKGSDAEQSADEDQSASVDAPEVITDIELSEDRKSISYEQASFSVVGEVQTNPTQGTEDNPKQYALVVKYDGTYYSIDSDGTLTPVDVDDADNPTTVTLGSPMLWSYGQNGTIYHHTDATDINAGQIAADFYYKYLDLNQEYGTYEEEKIDIKNDPAAVQNGTDYMGMPIWQNRHNLGDIKDGTDVTLVVRDTSHPIGNKYAWTVRTHKKDSACRVSYNTSTHVLTNQAGTYVLDVDRDNNNILRIVRKPASESSGLPVYFCDVSNSVPGVNPYQHTVSHIDISIEGSADIQVPLAYGTYYDAARNPVLKIEDGIYYEYRNGDWVVITGMDDAHPITVHKDFVGDDRITGEDIKSATITATDVNGNVLPESFGAYYITGYSMNAPENGEAEQVRIEGSFKVSTIPPISSANGALPNDETICANRKANAIKYKVTTIKHNQVLPVTYNGIQLYNGHNEKMELTTDITISSVPFTYWDLGNKCPPLWSGNNPATWQDRNGRTIRWQAGAIYTAAGSGWGAAGEDNPDWWLSGIDFRLSGNQVTARAEVPGLEVTKYILDDQGNQIALDAATYSDQPLESIIHVYEKASPNYESDDVLRLNGGDATRATGQLPVDGQYTDPTSNPAHANLYEGYTPITNYDFDVEVGLNGKGLEHNYHVTEGMYYIEEEKSSVAPKVIGADGTTYRYTQTHIETEYAWRDDEYVAKQWGGTYNEPVHVSPTYTDLESGTYRSIPEVLGNYKDKDSSWVQENGAPVRNTMLPFYVYNVYTPDVKLDVEKLWVNYEAPEGTVVTAELYYAKRKVKNADGTAVNPLSEWPNKDNYVPVAGATWDNTTTKIFEDGLVTQLTLQADADETKSWKGTFKNLPHRLTDAAGNVWEFDYLAKETAVTAGGESLVDQFDTAEHKTEPTAEEAHLSDGKVTIVNAKGGLTFEKKWLRPDGTEYEPLGTGPEADAVITGQLWRRRTVTTTTTVPGEDVTIQEEPVTVTVLARCNSGNYRQMFVVDQLGPGKSLRFSIGNNSTSWFDINSATVNPESAKSNLSSVNGQTVTYTGGNAGTKTGNANVYTLSNVTENTTIYATLTNGNTNDLGYWVDGNYERPGTITIPGEPTTTSTTAEEDEPVNITDRVSNGVVTLNKDNNWKFTLSAADMEPGWEYYIKTDQGSITEAGIDRDQFDFEPASGCTTDDDGNVTYTNINTALAGDLSLTKKVAGAGADLNKAFGFTITLKDSSGVPLTGTYDATLAGVASTATPDSDGKVTVALMNGQTYIIKDLPVGTTYTITEEDLAVGYTMSVTPEGGLSGTIAGGTTAAAVEVTNTYSAVDITVVKIDETTRNEAQQKKLEGAKFTLLKLNETTHEYEAHADSTGNSEKTTNDQGTLTFDTLPNGQYKLIESHVPDGYIAQSDLEVYFTASYDTQQEKAVVTWTNAEGQQITQQNLVGYEPSTKTFTIGNTPGKELPAAGGPGTLLGTLFGAAMIAAAVFVLVQRRRAQEA